MPCLLLTVLLTTGFYRVGSSNSVEGWTESVRVNMLQEVLDNRYLRSPVAIILDLDSRNVRSFKTLWYETAEQGLPDREILFYPVNEKEIEMSKIYSAERLSGRLGEYHPSRDASIEESTVAGPLFSAVLSAIAQLPFDSAAMVVTATSPKDTRLAPTVAEMLIRKRARLYVIWTGEETGDEDVLKETALLTGGAFYNMEMNSVIRTRMLRIENADLDQTIIRRKNVAGKAESSFVVPEGEHGFRINIIGNVTEALLIDPLGRTMDLFESTNASDVDLLISTQGMPTGAWLLITEGEPGETYDISVLKKAKDSDNELLSTEENTTDAIDRTADQLGEDNTALRYKRNPQQPGEKSADLVFPKEVEDLHNGSMKILSTSGQQKSVTPASIPIIVELAPGNNLEIRPGATTQLQFEVTNNVNFQTSAQFRAAGNGVIIQSVQPEQAFLMPFVTTRVTVNIASLGQIGGDGMITFTVLGGLRPTSRSAYLRYTTNSESDTWDPKITYTYKGDCKQYDEPSNCDNGQWSIEATIKDEDSGLLRVMSEPFGLLFSSEFIAGTRSPVSVTYVASCCKPKVDIWAEDLRGNYKRKSFDVFHQGLLDGEIAAIVVGVLLLLILILLIVLIVVYCRKRKADKIVLPRHTGK